MDILGGKTDINPLYLGYLDTGTKMGSKSPSKAPVQKPGDDRELTSPAIGKQKHRVSPAGTNRVPRNTGQAKDGRLARIPEIAARDIRLFEERVESAEAGLESAVQSARAFEWNAFVTCVDQKTASSGPHTGSTENLVIEQCSAKSEKEVNPTPQPESSVGSPKTAVPEVSIHKSQERNIRENRRQQEMQGWKAFLDGNRDDSPTLTPYGGFVEPGNDAVGLQGAPRDVTFEAVEQHVCWRKESEELISGEGRKEKLPDTTAELKLEHWELVTMS